MWSVHSLPDFSGWPETLFHQAKHKARHPSLCYSYQVLLAVKMLLSRPLPFVGCRRSQTSVGLNGRKISPRKTWQAARKEVASQADDLDLDSEVLVKWFGAIPLQTGIMSGALFLLGQATHALEAVNSLPGGIQGADASKALVTLYFLVIAIRSRIFSPLPANRPTVKAEEKERQAGLKRPSWAPPPIAFPIVWSTIGVLRCVSSVMIWETCGRNTLALPLIVMMFHLSAGDCWNHINVVQRRAGVAVPGVLFCLATVIAVTAAYYQTNETAGLLIAPSAVWISIASYLIYCIWDINGRPGELYPTKGESRRIAAEAGAQ